MGQRLDLFARVGMGMLTRGEVDLHWRVAYRCKKGDGNLHGFDFHFFSLFSFLIDIKERRKNERKILSWRGQRTQAQTEVKDENVKRQPRR